MGAEQSVSPAATPYPVAWSKNGSPFQEQHQFASISRMHPQEFMAVAAPISELDDSEWSFEAFMGYAAAAIRVDPLLRKMIDGLVPRRLTEDEFWRLFFCHVYHAVTNDGDRSKRPRPVDVSACIVSEEICPTEHYQRTPQELPQVECAAMVLSRPLLETGDNLACSAIASIFRLDETFQMLVKRETEAVQQQDAEDSEKLAAGVEMAVAKGMISASLPVKPVCTIDITNLPPSAVVVQILEQLGDAVMEGSVITLQGFSGIGKNLVLSQLREDMPNAVCWSNGDIFRALTLLAMSSCDQRGEQFNVDVLTPELLKDLMRCLKFTMVNGTCSVEIDGFGHKSCISEVSNTLLREPQVQKNVPKVAKLTQGEVIKFTGAAVSVMCNHGMNVLLQGRSQTLDYVDTPYRFELTVSACPSAIGTRQAAQRMIRASLNRLLSQDPSPEDVQSALRAELAPLAFQAFAANLADLQTSMQQTSKPSTTLA